MWLASQSGAASRGEKALPASMRPNRCKVMIEMGGATGTSLVLHVGAVQGNGARMPMS